MSGTEQLEDLLPIYYTRLFPFHDYYRWLSYGNSDLFERREFSFTIADDIYIRYKSFANSKHLEIEIKRLMPHKIDIGAIYNTAPKNEIKGNMLIPEQRELVFDIDMTDYDEVRTCCSGADICPKCWKYMAVACKILDVALREDFGFKHLLWVFSGRRGIHCWVCDEDARTLDSASRTAVAEYLELVTGGEYMYKKVNIRGENMHHSIRRAVDIIEPLFVPMCVIEQNMLGTEQGMNKFLLILPDETTRTEVRELFSKLENSSDRWEAFLKHYRSEINSGSKKWKRFLVEEIMIQYSYPRLDLNVTKGLNHLLKSPFCIHPKTGKVCVPFNPKSVDKFDPSTVPRIHELIEEINTFDAKEKAVQEDSNTKKIKDYKKTSLNKTLHIFQEFLRGLEDSRKGQKILQSDKKMEF
ncbi:DNA primase small subunit [Cephus cinctus]|uniref:DNA primase n=1 Tax=Cephus cinctus TaxID=211228 RepID=A0AAJ7W5T1_CEPCN|nr:DNA primase small subunit [Cephus cinctus]